MDHRKLDDAFSQESLDTCANVGAWGGWVGRARGRKEAPLLTF